MRAFLGSYRLEKRSKSHGVSENPITIGIPIQMNISLFLSISVHFEGKIIRALKTTSRKNYCELEGPLEMVGDRRVVPTSHRISWPETHGATCRMSWRGVVICS